MKQDNFALPTGKIVTDEEIEHLEMILRNPAGPSDLVLKGQDLLRQLRRQIKQEG